MTSSSCCRPSSNRHIIRRRLERVHCFSTYIPVYMCTDDGAGHPDQGGGGPGPASVRYRRCSREPGRDRRTVRAGMTERLASQCCIKQKSIATTKLITSFSFRLCGRKPEHTLKNIYQVFRSACFAQQVCRYFPMRTTNFCQDLKLDFFLFKSIPSEVSTSAS